MHEKKNKFHSTGSEERLGEFLQEPSPLKKKKKLQLDRLFLNSLFFF